MYILNIRGVKYKKDALVYILCLKFIIYTFNQWYPPQTFGRKCRDDKSLNLFKIPLIKLVIKSVGIQQILNTNNT